MIYPSLQILHVDHRVLKPLPVEAFTFTKVFPGSTDQLQYYQETAEPLVCAVCVSNSILGKLCVVLATEPSTSMHLTCAGA
jgi:hypothetical protein